MDAVKPKKYRVSADFTEQERDALDALSEIDYRPPPELLRWLVMQEARRRQILAEQPTMTRGENEITMMFCVNGEHEATMLANFYAMMKSHEEGDHTKMIAPEILWYFSLIFQWRKNDLPSYAYANDFLSQSAIGFLREAAGRFAATAETLKEYADKIAQEARPTA